MNKCAMGSGEATEKSRRGGATVVAPAPSAECVAQEAALQTVSVMRRVTV
jgi:hypothetical protein